MMKKNPLLKGRKTKTMQRQVLCLLERYNRLYRAERKIWGELERIVDGIILRELNRDGNDGVGWYTEVDPSRLEVGIKFNIYARDKRDRKHSPSAGDIKRSHNMCRRLGRTVIPAVQRALGDKIGYEVYVD